MNPRSFVFGGAIGLVLGLLGSVVLWRELHHTRIRLADFEDKDAKMKAHLQRRADFEDDLLNIRADRSRRRLSHDAE